MQWPMPIEVIQGEGVTLRPLATRDIPGMVAAINDPITEQFLPNIPRPYTEEDASEFVARGNVWAFVDEHDAYCGHMELRLTNQQDQVVEVGYLTLPDARGKGYTTRALKALMDYAFSQGAYRFEVLAMVNNAASRAVARKAGAVEEGILRGRIAHPDGHQDAVLHAKLANDE